MEVDEKAEGLTIQQAERRTHCRYAVDEDSELLFVERGLSVKCHILDLSLEGCRVRTREPFRVGAQSRVEVTFRVNGIAFRIRGLTQWMDGQHRMGIRFLGLSAPRKATLAEVLGEMQTEEADGTNKVAARLVRGEIEEQAHLPVGAKPVAQQTRIAPQEAGCQQARQAPVRRERRNQARREVDLPAVIFLVKIHSRVNGHVVDLSQSGCRIRTDERFPLGIYTRIEVLFHLHGLPVRFGGVIQAIHDRFNIGIRFLDMGERKLEQIELLIKEIKEMHERQKRAGSRDQSEDPRGS